MQAIIDFFFPPPRKIATHSHDFHTRRDQESGNHNFKEKIRKRSCSIFFSTSNNTFDWTTSIFVI